MATKGEETAARLLDAAEHLFARQGWRGASLRAIAAHAGITQPGLYNHFDSKEALYAAVLARGLQPLVDHMEQRRAQGTSVEGLAGQLTDLLARHPNVAGLVVRAMQGDGREEPATGMALDWLEKLMGAGRRLNEAAGFPLKDTELFLYQLASFNMACGYFWSAPLVRRLTGKSAGDADLLDAQKRLMDRIDRSMRRG